MRNSSRVTIKDIAKRCQVSTTTVSLVLNGHNSRFSPQTRELVLRTARELGYRPNQVAVSLVNQKSNTIGLVLPDMKQYYFATISKGAEHEGNQRGYVVFIGQTNDKPALDLSYLRTFIDHGVDGILFIRAGLSEPEHLARCVSLIRDSRLPVVLIDREVAGLSPTVLFDYRRSAVLGTSHLLALGHKKVACITGNKDYTSTIDRLNGYRETLAKNEIPFRPELVFYCDYKDPDSAARICRDIFRRQATAAITFNSTLALGVYQGTNHCGRSVPEDLSVVSLDETYAAELLDVPLTTILQPMEEMGRTAMSALLDMVEGKGSAAPTDKRLFTPQLKVRASSAPLEEKY